MSRKLLYLIIFLASVFTLSIIWWILPTRPVFEAAGINVGIAITGPPPMSKPPLLLEFGDNGKVTFFGTYWHPQIIYLEIGGDLSKNVTINNSAPLSDAWSYPDYFSEGHYWVQIYIVDTIGRTSPYSDKVFFKIGNPGEPGQEEKREPGGESIVDKIIRTIKNIGEMLDKNKTMIAIATIVTAALSFLSMLISFLIMLATQLSLRTYLLLIINYLLAFFRRKKGKRGIVYDYATNQPLQGVLVSVFKIPEMRQIASAVTDKDGGFLFVVDQGDYAVQVKKDGYVFPAKINKETAQLQGLYIGQTLHIADKSGVINPKIPIQVQELSLMRRTTPGYLAKLFRWSDVIRIILLIAGSIASVLILYYSQSTLNYILAGSYIVLWIIELVMVSKKVRFSRVLDAENKKSIDLAMVRTVSPEGKLTQTYVTDVLGRFLPYVPSPEHHFSIRKPGYEEVAFKPGTEKLVEGKRFFLQKQKEQAQSTNFEARNDS